MSSSWEPEWFAEGVQVAAPAKMKPTKYVWGNMPAIDILNLPKNETVSHKEDLALLFASTCIHVHQNASNRRTDKALS